MTKPQEREVLKLRHANGALLNAPLYDKGARRSNYLAIIDIDPTAPAGLAREFCDKGRGDCLYLTEKLDLFDAVEFASDYTTTTGNKYRERWYGVIIAKTDDYLLVEKAPSGVKAVLRAKEARVSVQDKVRALQAEKEQLVIRAAVIEGEIAQLTEEPAPAVVAEGTPAENSSSDSSESASGPGPSAPSSQEIPQGQE